MPGEHDELKELIPPYVIGALPQEEESAIRAHILSCEECLAEADTYSTVASSLVFAVEPESPPQGFVERTMSRLDDEAARRGALEARRWSWIHALSYATLLIVAVLLAAALIQTRSDLANQEEALAALGRRGGLALAGEEAVGRMVPTSEGSMLVVAGLQSPPEGRIYQLWLIGENGPMSAGTFDVAQGITVVKSAARLREHRAAAVTVEPAPEGSAQPTTPPVMRSA